MASADSGVSDDVGAMTGGDGAHGAGRGAGAGAGAGGTPDAGAAVVAALSVHALGGSGDTAPCGSDCAGAGGGGGSGSGAGEVVACVALDDATVVHFVRHAEATHNEMFLTHGRAAYAMEANIDAPLTATGVAQAQGLRDALIEAPRPIDMVLVSPLARTLGTLAELLPYARLPRDEWPDTVPVLGGGAPVPIVAEELLRERIGGANICDKRRTVEEYKAEYPGVDFSGVETNDDTWWSARREPPADVVARGFRALAKVAALPARHVMLVTHSSLLLHTLSAAKLAPDASVSQLLDIHESLGPKFDNAELRSALVHRAAVAGTGADAGDASSDATGVDPDAAASVVAAAVDNGPAVTAAGAVVTTAVVQ